LPKHLTEEQKLSIRKKRNSEDRHSPGYMKRYMLEYQRKKRAKKPVDKAV
jgi:hypothetical protein